jgi:SAM-dependent methyltransferase
MPWKYTDEYYTEYTRTTWNESAQGYLAYMHLLAPFGEELLKDLDPRPGEAALDLGTGPGEPAMTIARRVAPAPVVGVDLAEEMVRLATGLAKEQGLSNVTFRAMDCAHLDLPSETFDLAVSRFGFQIFTDPEQAAREAHRVLKPGGRIGVTVWGRGPQVPWLDVIIAPMLEHAEPDETGYLPTPYETGGPGEMVGFLEAAGFHDGRERRVGRTIEVDSPEAYFAFALNGTPIGHSLKEESEEVQREVLTKTRANLEKYRADGRIRLPAEVAIVTAHR